MLFNSVEFLVFFLPQVILGFLLLRTRQQAVLLWLTVASLFFYGWWQPSYLTLLLGSAAVNYSLARVLSGISGERARRLLLTTGVVANLSLLGFYKYAGLLVDTLAGMLGQNWESPSPVLPLAISFFTLQQIAYLVDVYQGQSAERRPLVYLLFVCFFPQLIAGPIVHHRQLVPQLSRLSARFDVRLLAPAVALVILGLAKKVLVADSLDLLVTPGFDPGLALQLSAADAWMCMLAYTLQLYFDFSGYCDIALGLALLFGIRLPVNFMSPLRAASIIDFWRRWHMTLSAFLRDYVYFPLGGNRRGQLRRGINLMLTMLIGGLWHGAGWNFVLWGGLHGVFLLLNHSYRALFPGEGGMMRHYFGRLLTFLLVCMAFVYFRAPSVAIANGVLQSLAGDLGVGFSEPYLLALSGAMQSDLLAIAIQEMSAATVSVTLLLLALGIAQFAPNSLQLVNDSSVGFENVGEAGRLRFRPNLAWAISLACLLWLVLISLTSVSPFLYFQF